MALRIGLWGARADDTGLGNLTKEFFDHMKPAKTMVVNIDIFTGNTSHVERYPGATVTSRGYPTPLEIDEWCKDLDVVYCVETPYDYELFNIARARGIKTVLHFMFEFLDYFQLPHLARPDLMLAASTWRQDEFPSQLLEVPVSREHLPFRARKEAKTFVHIAGANAIHSRNGTDTLLSAIPLVKSDVKFIIHSQKPLPYNDDPRLTVLVGNTDRYWDMYRGDVLVMPRKYGGLCLPLNEAMSTGMVPIMTDISPQNGFLHPDTLIPAKLVGNFDARTKIDIYEADPQDLADKIDELANRNILELSSFSAGYANSISWENQKPHYIALFEALCLQ